MHGQATIGIPGKGLDESVLDLPGDRPSMHGGGSDVIRISLGLAVALLALQGCAAMPRESLVTDPPSVAERVAAEGVVQLPLVVRGYPFVPGEVNGRRGYFMIDNGTPFRFFLNSTHAPVTPGAEVGRGQAGSGQAIVVHETRDLSSLRLGPDLAGEVGPDGVSSTAGIMVGDFGFIETGLPLGFLGFVGAPWLSDFAYSLRYEPPRWWLADADDGADRLEEGSERVALIRFEGQDGSLPYATLEVDGEDLHARFDTGTPGVLDLTADRKARLERVGALRCQEGVGPEAHTMCELSGLRHGDVALELDPLLTRVGPDTRITLGTALLRRYTSVWNLRHSTLDLRREPAP